MRKTQFVNGEFYHIYNRGVDKRNIFSKPEDVSRFLMCMQLFNTLDPVGGLHQIFFNRDRNNKKRGRLVDVVCYCLMPNHFHFVLRQASDRGVEKFMHRLGTGHTRYFNDKYKRSGSLFQGSYKAIHIGTNEYLLHVSAYINLNDKAHKIKSAGSKLVRSSWNEYINNNANVNSYICKKDIILKQFKPDEYIGFAKSSLSDIISRKSIYHDEFNNLEA